MTILFMYDSPLLPEVGGTERATRLVMDELERRGHTCIGLLHFDQQNPDAYFLNGKRITSLSAFLTNRLVDVVVNQIAFHYWLLEAFLEHGGREWRKKGGKIISFMHFDPDFKDVFFRNAFVGWRQLSAVAKIKKIGLFLYTPYLKYKSQRTKDESYRYVYRSSDAFVVMSPSYIGKIQQHAQLTDVSKLRVITNMLTFPTIADSSLLEHKKRSVLVVARLDENQKKISTLLSCWKAVVDHRGYTLDIVGTGKDEARYRRWVERKRLDDVVFHGQQSPLPYYQRAAIFLMSSPREGWGLTITESYQNGVVPIVMDTSAVFHDIIEEGVTGFLPKDKFEFRDKLQFLLENATQRNAMAEAGLKKAAAFSPSVVGDAWENLLCSL